MKQLVSFVSYLEGFSALFLFAIAMPVKYIGGDPELVSLVGAIPVSYTHLTLPTTVRV